MFVVKFSVVSDSVPVENVDISFFYQNGTYLETKTDADGIAYLELDDNSIELNEKITLFFAKDGYEAFVIKDAEIWQEQKIDLKELSSGGSIICHGTCHIPNFTGRLEPIFDTEERIGLYATNIAIEGGGKQPLYFNVGERFTLQDKDRKAIHLNVKAMIARSSILEYKTAPQDFEMPKPNPPTAFSSTDNEENQLIRLGHNNPPAEEIIELEETIRSIETINEPMENREELLAPVKTVLESIKAWWISKDILRSAIDALKNISNFVIKMIDLVSKIKRAIEIIDNIGKSLGFW